MKQIFDWLREQMNETIELNCKRLKHDESLMCHDRNFGIKQALCKVDEAETKWEADCCVINHFNGNRIVVEVHGNQFYRRCVDGWKSCPYCGKPIKIAEVE